MSKVLVDRELLERAMYANDGKELIAANRELRAILAQPAEAEGVEVVAWQQRYICPDEGPSCWQSADERTVEILRRRDDYELRQLVPLTALSAVTAERDRLREAAELLSRLRGLINCTPENDIDKIPVWISTKHPTIERIDALEAAMAAKEA